MNRNRTCRKTIAATLCITLAAGMVIPANGAEQMEKDENVYVNLNQDGSVSNIYVVNEYNLDRKTDLLDYGFYSSLKNLSSEDKITADGDRVLVHAPKGRFLYQGELQDPVLPWKIGIAYALDGEEIPAEDLAGKSGKLRIVITVKENPESETTFFDNYLVQGTVTLNTDQCSNIRADGATQANAGKNRQLLYNIMAGQEKEFIITANVTEFEMDAISFQAVPMSFDIDSDALEMDALTEKTDEIKEAAADFEKGAGELDDGASELLDGVNEMKNGAGELKDGTFDLASGAGELSSGADSLNSGLRSLNSGLSSLNKGISSLNVGAFEVNSGAKNLEDGARQAAEGSENLKEGTDTLFESLKQMQAGAEELKNGLSALTEKTPELTQGSEKVLEDLQQIQGSLSSIEVGTEQMQPLIFGLWWGQSLHCMPFFRLIL